MKYTPMRRSRHKSENINRSSVKNERYNFSNPRKIGPGVWYSFHLNSSQAVSESEKLILCKQIRYFCEYFGCKDCQGHCKEYVNKYPPEKYIHTTDGLFRWTVDFRNAVQKRLNAPEYDYHILYSMFHGGDFKVCQSGCGDKNKDEPVITITASKEDVRRINEKLRGIVIDNTRPKISQKYSTKNRQSTYRGYR